MARDSCPQTLFALASILQLPEKLGKHVNLFEAASRGASSKRLTYPGPRVATAEVAVPKFKAPVGATKEFLETLRCPAHAEGKARVMYSVHVCLKAF